MESEETSQQSTSKKSEKKTWDLHYSRLSLYIDSNNARFFLFGGKALKMTIHLHDV